MQSAKEAGLCAECPYLSIELKSASERDIEEASENVMTDEQIDMKYTPDMVLVNPAAAAMYKSSIQLNEPTLRAGAQRHRDIASESSVQHISILGGMLDDTPCEGANIANTTLDVSPRVQDQIEKYPWLEGLVSQLSVMNACPIESRFWSQVREKFLVIEGE
jgi:hypothetical protein